MRYLFELGRVTSLSRAEIEQTLIQLKVNFTILNLSQHFLFIESKEELGEQSLIERLGGTISIAAQVGDIVHPAQDIANILLKSQPTGKIQFSIHAEHERKLAEEVKGLLKQADRSVRYIPPRNTATIIYNKLVQKQGDITIIDRAIYLTRAVQPIEAWSERDFGRPGRDSESGMLPPKLARMMINISGASHSEVLLDPFCGSGTVLTEALLLGFTQVIGSDNSEQAIIDTKKNVSWILEKKKREIVPSLFKSDVRELMSQFGKNSIGTIIAEPYMGKPLTGHEREEFLHTQAKELGKLYVDAFRTFQIILKPDGVIVFIIPRFWYRGKWIPVDCRDRIEREGFEVIPLTHHEPYILYHRPGQFVGREVWKLRKK
jgi:tRNA G10  N-methylase Trm11